MSKPSLFLKNDRCQSSFLLKMTILSLQERRFEVVAGISNRNKGGGGGGSRWPRWSIILSNARIRVAGSAYESSVRQVSY